MRRVIVLQLTHQRVVGVARLLGLGALGSKRMSLL